MTAKKNEPVYKFRMGRIVGTVWYNERDDGRGRHSVRIEKLYKPKDSAGWKRTTCFGRDDLPLVAKVPDRCHSWIHTLWQKQSFYCLCDGCDAKWFSDSLGTRCPRCGGENIRSTTATPPWTAA